MFHLTLMQNITHLFEGFSILKKSDDSIKCLYNFADSFSLSQYYEFIFPCDCPRDKSEEYTIVISNTYNSRSFLICRYIEAHKLYLCIYSYNPWFEILSKVLLNLCNSEFLDNFPRIDNYLNQIYCLDNKDYVTLPACNSNDKISQQYLKCSLKFPFIYDKYIQEYLTAVVPAAKYNKQLWLEIFWSMLLERPIIFMSKRYQKLTSSLLAAIFFIHPLSWVHKIVSIIPKKSPELLGMNCCMLGIHSCMEPILAKVDYWNEALLVDLDRGESRMVGGCDNEKETAKRFKVPKFIRTFFISVLSSVDDSVSQNSPMQIRNMISNIPWNINDKEETMYNEYKKGFHVYSLLFRTLIAILIGHYRECIIESGGIYKFDRNKFTDYNSRISEFLKLLVNSQCFNSFIDERISLILNNETFNDRFDRERKEFEFQDKRFFKILKFDMFSKKLNTVINTKSEDNLTRKGKISTMPPMKKNKIHKVSQMKKSSFNTIPKSPSLSSSISSLNSLTTKKSKKKNSFDNISIQSESLTSQVIQGLIDRQIFTPSSLINHNSQNTPILNTDNNSTPITAQNMSNSDPNEKGKRTPARPPVPALYNKYFPNKPNPPLPNKLKDTKIPTGLVKDRIQNLNKIDQAVNSNSIQSNRVRERSHSIPLMPSTDNSLTKSNNE